MDKHQFLDECMKGLTESVKASSGTFVGTRLSTETNAQLSAWMDMMLIPNREPSHKLHATILVDLEKSLPIKPMLFDPAIEVDPSTYAFELFGPENDTLVLTFDSPRLTRRHYQLVNHFDVNTLYPTYRAHVTLGKSAAPLDSELELPTFSLKFEKEYIEPFD